LLHFLIAMLTAIKMFAVMLSVAAASRIIETEAFANIPLAVMDDFHFAVLQYLK